jgi:hypothetical protein
MLMSVGPTYFNKNQNQKLKSESKKIWCVFRTRDLNLDSEIQIHNHRVPQKKMMFGTRDLSED